MTSGHRHLLRRATGALLSALLVLALLDDGQAATIRADRDDVPDTLFVDPSARATKQDGSERRPYRTLSEAIARLPDLLDRSVTIRLGPGQHATTGEEGMPEHTLHLMRRMAPDVRVTIEGPEDGPAPVLAWGDGGTMLRVKEGSWRLRRVQIGTFRRTQRRGIEVTGPADVVLDSVTFRLRSLSDGAILATGGGRVGLRGAIDVNGHLHDEAEEETYSGILAYRHGIVEFEKREGASLDMGNGSLSVRHYGIIRLGCASARITCWTRSNNLTINNGGRIDVLNTPVTLVAKDRKNTPIGLEHDGHILAEDAKITIRGKNDSAIALQKASTFTCNDIELGGEFRYAVWASSGSMFVGRFLTDVNRLRAKTGAQIHVEETEGRPALEVHGPIEVFSGGLVTLPDRTVRPEQDG